MFQDGSGRWLTLAADPQRLAKEHPTETAPSRYGTENSPGTTRRSSAGLPGPAEAGQTRRNLSSTERRHLHAPRLYHPTKGRATLRAAACPPPSRSRPSTGASAPTGRPKAQLVSREGPRYSAPHARSAESDRQTRQALPFASRRFHVLFNSLFKVLFNFPSRYLFAIGLATVFSLRWSLPPALGCIPKQPDSGKTPRARTRRRQGPDTR